MSGYGLSWLLVLVSLGLEMEYSSRLSFEHDVQNWVLSQEGDRWSVKFDVRDLGGHLDTTFRGWSSNLAARVRLIFALPLFFLW